MSIVFIGTPEFAVPFLQRLVSDGHPLSAVFTRPDRPAGRGRRTMPPPVKAAARELGLTVEQPPDLRDPEAYGRLAGYRPDVIVAVAYGQLLPPDVLSLAPRGVVNVHPSLLPRWRGASPIQSAILAGDSETGVTIMLMDEGMDTGPILATSRAHPISPDDTAGSLGADLSHLGAGLLAETLPKWLAGEIEPTPQDREAATTCRLIRREDGLIDWDAPAETIWREVRAYNPWPGAYTYLDGDLVHIWRAWPLAEGSARPPGTVVAVEPGGLPGGGQGAGFAVQTGEGLLAVIEVQRAGRRALPAPEFVRGVPQLPGKRFTDGK